MALRFNGLSPTGANPFSAMCTSQIGFTSAAVGTTANLTTQWGRGERHAVKTSFGEYASNPPAAENPIAWTMADKGGDLAAENSVNQSNTLTLVSLSLGKDLAASLTQDGSITAAALSMIASLATDMQQSGTVTGPMQMTLNMAASMVQDGQIDAGLGLIAWMQASLTQDADMSASNLRGTLSMAANIVSYSEFTAEGVRDAVWNAILANYPNTGSAGLALSTASSGGVDYGALADAVRAELGAELSAVLEVWRRHGLDITAPLTQTASAITAGTIDLAITGDPDTSVTVTRQP